MNVWICGNRKPKKKTLEAIWGMMDRLMKKKIKEPKTKETLYARSRN